ncbi:MAG: FxsA family protein [Emcibacteraceae bacterium]|nr:FxsA family protein [Emcibacteraceae bacterium]MDG1996569.1 FxsA family protein [Emcibacteraceae bacterium]
MPFIFLLALFMVPYLEFLVFAEVADEIGGLSAIMLTIFTAFLGIYIIRQEGIQVLAKLKNTVDRGESPVQELIHGFFLAVAGFFFLLPGFITDSIAIMLAIGPIRAILGRFMVSAGQRSQQSRPTSSFSSGIIIDGEFEESHMEQDKDIESIEQDKDDIK